MPRSKKVSEQMRAESRAQLLSAARKLFAERGYFTCKVSDIAREAGMSQGNLYWYFSGKEDLLKAVLAEGFDALAGMAQAAADHPGPAREKVDVLLERMLVFCRKQGSFSMILLSLMAHGGTSFLQELGFDMLEIGSGYHRHLVALFDEARAAGVAPDLDPNVLVMFFFAFFNGLTITYGEDWLSLPPEQFREAALRLLGVA